MTNNKKVSTRTAIGERIRKLRRENHLSQVQVAEDLCISQAAYSLIENSQNGIVADHVIRLSGLYGVTTDYILKGNSMLLEISPENGFLPFIKVDAIGGFVKNFDKGMQFKAEDWFRIPNSEPATADQKLFEVEGDSMVPTIFPNDVVLCQVQEKIDNLLSGSLILIVTYDSVAVKRFDKFDEEGNLVLLDDNPEKKKEVYTIRRDQVRQVMIIRGKVSSSLVPHHHVVSQGKMKVMEDSIEFLKTQLKKLNEKLGDQN